MGGSIRLIRHVETESNKLGLFGDGPLDDQLSAKGAAQINALVRCLMHREGRGDIVLSGTSTRQLLTAYTHPEGHRIVSGFGGLNEIGVGEWSGMSKTDIDPQLLADWRAGKILPPDGETDDQFESRVRAVWKGIIHPQAADGDSLIVVSSGNPIRIILGEVLGIPWRCMLPTLDIDNAGITTLRLGKEGKCFITSVNDTSHLADIGVTKIAGT